MQAGFSGAASARNAGHAAPRPQNTRQPVIVVGAGPAGMATALELAHQGQHVVVLDKRGPIGTRENLFNVIPAFADNLARLAPDGSLTSVLVPTRQMHLADLDRGTQHLRTFNPPEFAPDPNRSRKDVGALLAALKSPDDQGVDLRPWAKIGIGDLETAMRQYARRAFPDLIDMRFQTTVAGVEQSAEGVRALLAPTTPGGVAEAVEGAFLVDASGRNLSGAPLLRYPEVSHWVGGRFAGVGAEGDTSTRRSSAVVRADAGSTIVLPTTDRTMVWTTSHVDTSQIDEAAQRALLEQRAAANGVAGGLVEGARPMPVKMQLTESLAPALGRIYAVGDSVRAPYFPTSSGAAAAIVHDAPAAADAIMAAQRGDLDVASAAEQYSSEVRSANAGIIAKSRSQFARDIGLSADQLGDPVQVSAAATSR